LPHVVLEGRPNLPHVHQTFQQVAAKSNGWILKLNRIYISADSRALMIECTAVRSGFAQDFYLRADQRDTQLTVRVDPLMRIERNEGVQRCIVLVARLIRQKGSDIVLLKTNLPAEIAESFTQEGEES